MEDGRVGWTRGMEKGKEREGERGRGGENSKLCCA